VATVEPHGVASALVRVRTDVGRFVRENSLSLCFGGLFLLALSGQAMAGHRAYNAERVDHGTQAVSLGAYVASSHFGEALIENWQSEFLQFALLILATIWLVQRGSNESKRPAEAGVESKRKQRIGYASRADSPTWARVGGVRTWVYSNSLFITMAALFAASWLVQSLAGWREFNDAQRAHQGSPIGWTGYLGNADFWEKTLQNWQSEFLAVGVLAVFSIYLRQRGSIQSKPVGAPHEETGTSG
jgi:hypothetical protein